MSSHHPPPSTRNSARHTTITATPPLRSARYTTPLLAELDREWARIRRHPRIIRQVRGWSTDPVLSPVVAGLTDLDDLVRATHRGSVGNDQSDAMLRCLIAKSAGEELAGRIVLQRILPGLISRSRRWHGSRDVDTCDIAVGAAWLAIRSFDVRARSAQAAPSLIADSLWLGFRRDSRRKVEREVPVAGAVLVSRPAPTLEIAPVEALAGTLRAARRAGVPAADLDLIRCLVAAGSPSKAARDCKVTVRTIRNRRDVATRRIRRALGPDWSDWADPLVAA